MYGPSLINKNRILARTHRRRKINRNGEPDWTDIFADVPGVGSRFQLSERHARPLNSSGLYEISLQLEPWYDAELEYDEEGNLKYPNIDFSPNLSTEQPAEG